MTRNPTNTESEIERLMGQSPVVRPRPAAAPSTTPFPIAAEPSAVQVPLPPMPPTVTKAVAKEATKVATPSAAAEPALHPGDAEELLRQAELAVQSMRMPPREELPPGVATFRFEELQDSPVTADAANLDLIRDVELNLKIELGRTQMSLDDVLKLRKGSVVSLDRRTGEPVDIYANGRLVARGEVLVLENNFCVRVLELVAGTSKAA